MAIHKAILAEMDYKCSNIPVVQETLHVTNCGDTEKVICMNLVSNCIILQKSSDKKKYTQACDGCGLIFPGSTLKKMETRLKARFLYGHCIKLTKLKLYYGVCKKIWHHFDRRSWVCYDNCDVLVQVICHFRLQRRVQEIKILVED